MPSFKTHSIHGELVLPGIDKKTEINKEDIKSFCIGPDAMAITDSKTFNYQHANRTRRFFCTLINLIKRKKLLENSEVMAFLYSQIDHFVLDSTMHPLIYYMTENIKPRHVLKPHALIENWIDDYTCLKYKRKQLGYYRKWLIQNKKLIDGLVKIIRIIFNSFDYIIKEELNNIEDYYKSGNYEIIIYQAFSLIIKCISSSPFQKEFYPVAKNFVFFKIFPFLTLDLGEEELFKESPDEYYLQVIDIMTEFSFKKIKTICGKCLTLIGENYPDLSFIILNIIFELLIFFMEEFDRNNLYKYTLINNEIGEFFMESYTNESIISSCLLCISILAKQAMINSELKKSLHKFLLDNQMRLENVASDKIQFKLCLLYGLFLDGLFNINNNEDKEFIRTAINFLLSIILYS